MHPIGDQSVNHQIHPNAMQQTCQTRAIQNATSDILRKMRGERRKFSCWNIHNLARIHYPIRIQRLLDCLHHIERLWTDFHEKSLFLPDTDSMLALPQVSRLPSQMRNTGETHRTSPLHIQCSLHHILHATLDLLPLTLHPFVIHDAFVKIAISDMTKDTRK